MSDLSEAKRKLRNGDRSDVIERHGDEWRHAQAKGGICVGTTTHETLAEAKRSTWSDNVTIKR